MWTLDALPAEIQQSDDRCVVWRRENANGNGRVTKLPYVATDVTRLASSTDPQTWRSFRDARTAYEDGKADGPGFVLGDGYVGIDIDHCVGPGGHIDDDARAIITAVGSYTEYSPSGAGIHILARGSLPPGRRRVGRYELYDSGRYFTLTGHHVVGTPSGLVEATSALHPLHRRLFGATSAHEKAPKPDAGTVLEDQALLDRMFQASNGSAIRALWEGDLCGYASASEADLALCAHLAFWTDRDDHRIDGLFRQSSLMRPKWDEHRGAETYGERTIATAIAGCAEGYTVPLPDPDVIIGEPTATSPPALRFQHVSDIIAEPPPVEIIEGVAWAGCVTVLVSESGAGKTFVLLDAAAAVSDAVLWHSRTTRLGSVAYLGFEGDALGLRLRALRDVKGHRLEHVYVLRASDPLSPRVARDGTEAPSLGEVAAAAALEALAEELAATGRPPIALVMVDTVRASLTGSEDSSEHVSAYLRAVRRIMRRVPNPDRTGAILAHHAGWQDGDTQRKRERGSSAFRGNADATLFLEVGTFDAERGEAALTLRALKVRDCERPAPLHLLRRRVDLLEIDARGEPVTSCVIESDRRSHQDREAEHTLAAEALHRDTDRQVIRAMRDYPAATNTRALRAYLGLRYGVVQEAVGRILRAGWAVEGRRGQGYTLTDEGRRQT